MNSRGYEQWRGIQVAVAFFQTHDLMHAFFILSLTFEVLRFRIGNVLFLKHGYEAISRTERDPPRRLSVARTAAASPLAVHRRLRTLPPDTLSQSWLEIRKKVCGSQDGSAWRGRRAWLSAATGPRRPRAESSLRETHVLQADVHSIYNVKLGVRAPRTSALTS